MGKLGAVPPEPGPVQAPRQGPEQNVGVVAQNQVKQPNVSAPPPLGVVPPNEVVVNVKPQSPVEPSFGVVGNIAKVSAPPPPPPKPIGVMEPEADFPEAFVPQKPKIGILNQQAVTPAAVAANVPEIPGADRPLVSIPNVIDPFQGREDEKK